MCDHSPNREAAMVVIDPGTPERQGRDGVWCDPCLEPLVRALNDGGLRTVASCCGHGKRPGNIALADGRELVLMPDYEAARALDDHFHNLASDLDTRAEVVAKYAPTIWEVGRNAGLLDALREHGPVDENEALLWLVMTPRTDVNPYEGVPFDFEAHDADSPAPAVDEGTDWFREQHDRAKERNAQVPPHARMVVTNPELSAHHRPAAVAEGTDVGALAEAWDEGRDATAEWMANNPGPSGIPHDPPTNPYDRGGA